MERPAVGELTPPNRTLMGPGPSDVHPRVRRAMATPLVGHLDPAFVDLMDEVQELLRYVFRTDNEWTVPISGTGSAAMEAAIANLTEPGDTVVVPGNGYFGGRMASMVERSGGETVTVDAPWGEPLDIDDVRAAFDAHDPDLLAFVHGETSTGVLQPNVPALTELAHDNDALTIVDAVTTFGGVELKVDEWEIDAAYSAAQKCLSAPPGASPLTLGERAMAKIEQRESSVNSWYLDLTELTDYWGEERAYHHTAPITNVYALREALRLAAEEGIEARWERHERVANGLRAGIEAMGLELASTSWLPSLNTVRLPADIEDSTVTDELLDGYDIEVAGGLGDLSGEILRIGCMGHSARRSNVLSVLGALGDVLGESAGIDADAGLAAARKELSN
ncbi:alanine--glyoxylate aminotransferase family protein [Halococcus dombrowskii]|uniref:Alanine--glyoxylate aminotransferase family protein n=1 Tax=Halococcus dombrowskii TaxID=179637 RepID=A0AAV3SDZ7_HALDO|nr:alanine--glyoxylate aminotransferase family protein [Halococcus dombrowskii]UOO95029.1 alanine--glyoxylate aminotransferase family protein [Halococcus dombrowskii]